MEQITIHLQTTRVNGYRSDGTQTTDKFVQKLDYGFTWTKVLKYINTKGYIISEPPKVVKATKMVGGKRVDIDHSKFQKELEAAWNPIRVVGRPDYKKELELEKAKNNDLLARLEALENKIHKINKPAGKPKSAGRKTPIKPKATEKKSTDKSII